MSDRVVYLADLQGRRLGWSRYELLHLRRATKALRHAWLCLEACSGVTDEGDPWFVLCEVDSDRILAHFARISGVYIASFPFQKRSSLTDGALPELIDRFLRRYLFELRARWHR